MTTCHVPLRDAKGKPVRLCGLPAYRDGLCRIHYAARRPE